MKIVCYQVVDNLRVCVVQNGLIVNFLGSFYGVIDYFSLRRPMTSNQIKSKYSRGDVLTARVVFVDHATKSFRLSIRPHVMALRAPVALPKLGTLIDLLTD